MADDDWLAAANARLERDSQRLDGLLVTAGFTPVGATSLFRLVRHDDAREMIDRLAARASMSVPSADNRNGCGSACPAPTRPFCAWQAPSKKVSHRMRHLRCRWHKGFISKCLTPCYTPCRFSLATFCCAHASSLNF